MNAYDFPHDFAHTTGFVDEDMDYELPDPVVAMHFNKTRSGPIAIIGAIISLGLLIGYPIFGLKMPQKDNPFYYRKKYGSPTTVEQMQGVALLEYGSTMEKSPETNVMLGPNGFQMVNNGIRIDLDNYKDLVC